MQWKFKFSIPNFPHQAAQVSAFPYFLSPNFEFMFSYNYAGRNLRILRTETQVVMTEFSKDYLTIPMNPTD